MPNRPEHLIPEGLPTFIISVGTQVVLKSAKRVPGSDIVKRREIPADLGDGLLFCTRDRLVQVGGAYGLQPVKHGVNPITEGSRLVLGIPFHEYR